MVPAPRDRFNASFTEKKYGAMLNGIHATCGHALPFRVAESPVFVPASFLAMMQEAAEVVISLIRSPDFKALSEKAIPRSFHIPNEPDKPLFMALDFGVCADPDGNPVPRLIELQGFPSLFGWEHFVAKKYREHFDVSEGYSHLFGLGEAAYLGLLKKHIVGNHRPENVVLLDIEPEKQTTYIDFLLTRRWLGVRPVCVTDLKSEGRAVYYTDQGKKVPVHRIYNRVIYDELKQRRIEPGFDITGDLDVEWAGHPNWFFRVSKFIMPWLESRYIPACRFLDRISTLPADLENYVLKPLYSFSGSGVQYHVTESDIRSIQNPQDYLLQEKVAYASVIRAPGESVKAELRLLYMWDPGEASPALVINMARLSKGEMVGVKYNKNKTWVGGSVGFYEQ